MKKYYKFKHMKDESKSKFRDSLGDLLNDLPDEVETVHRKILMEWMEQFPQFQILHLLYENNRFAYFD